MSKKNETGKSATVLELDLKIDTAIDMPMPVRQAYKKKTASLHARMPRVSIQKIRAQYHFAPVADRAALDARTLRANELQSVYALLAWVANEQEAAIDTVREITETKFLVDDVTKLKQKDYDEVIKFLVDLRIDELKN